MKLPGQTTATNTLPVNFRITFNEVLNESSFAATDIENAGTATGVTWVVTDSGDHLTFNIAANVSGNGSLQPRILSGSVADLASNLNIGSTASSNVVTYVVAPLTVTLEQASGQLDDARGGQDLVGVVLRRSN